MSDRHANVPSGDETAALIADRLAEICGRLNKVTQGNWAHTQHLPEYSQVEADSTPSPIALIGVSAADGEFMAHSKADIEFLLARLGAAELERLRRAENTVKAEALMQAAEDIELGDWTHHGNYSDRWNAEAEASTWLERRAAALLAAPTEESNG